VRTFFSSGASVRRSLGAVSELERRISAFLSTQPGKLEEVIEAREEGLENVRLALK
jgi:hypothetical protein